MSEDGGVEVSSEGVDVMEHEGFELGAFGEEVGEGAIEEEVRDFVVVAHGVEALEGEVVGVVGGLSGGFGPIDEGGAKGVADFLLLFVEDLLGHFFPGEAEVAFGGDHAQSDGSSG